MPNINIKLSDECHKKIKVNASKRGQTITGYVNEILNRVRPVNGGGK